MFFEQKVISGQDSASDRVVEAVMTNVGEQRLRRRLLRRSKAVLQSIVSGILGRQFKINGRCFKTNHWLKLTP
jgi:hypothetical protein